MGYTEGLQCGLSTMALLEVLNLKVVKAKLVADNQAALSLCCSDTGAWRTRHLRLRSARLRELLADEASGWVARYCPGADLIADGFTKSLQGQAFVKFRGMLNMYLGEKEPPAREGGDEDPGKLRKRPETESDQGNLGAATTALAAASVALLSAGQTQVGSLVALCAAIVEGGSRAMRAMKPASKVKEESRKSGGRTTKSAQDDKPYRWGGVTQDGKPSGGGATEDAQDGTAAPRVSGSGLMARTVTPGLRAFHARSGSGRHGEQMPIPPEERPRGSAEGSRVGYARCHDGEVSATARARAASGEQKHLPTTSTKAASSVSPSTPRGRPLAVGISNIGTRAMWCGGIGNSGRCRSSLCINRPHAEESIFTKIG